MKEGEEEVGGVGWFWVRWEVRRYRKCDYVELCLFKQALRRIQLEGMYLQVSCVHRTIRICHCIHGEVMHSDVIMCLTYSERSIVSSLLHIYTHVCYVFRASWSEPHLVCTIPALSITPTVVGVYRDSPGSSALNLYI